jgi:hypothetical protein
MPFNETFLDECQLAHQGPRRSVLGSRILDCNCFAIFGARSISADHWSTSRRRRGGADSRFSCRVVMVLGGTPVAFSDPSGRIYWILSSLCRVCGTHNRNHLVQ